MPVTHSLSHSLSDISDLLNLRYHRLKKMGHVYSFTSKFWNIDYYSTLSNKKEKNRWNKIYKKYKPYSSDIDFNLEDINDDVICKKVYIDVRKN